MGGTGGSGIGGTGSGGGGPGGLGARHAVDAPQPAAGLLVDPALLDGEFDGLEERELAARIDASLRALAAPEAALDVAIGRGLDRLTSGGWFRDLGHSRLRDFAPARYGFSWSHGRELRDVARALERLPGLRRAFLSGALSRSKVRAIVRVATPEDELGWIGLARRAGVRELEEHARAVRAGERAAPHAPPCDPASPGEGDPEDTVRVRWRSLPADAAAWLGWGRDMLRVVTGEDGEDWKLAEALAADTLARLGGAADVGAGGASGLSPTHPAPGPRARRRQRLSRRGLRRFARAARKCWRHEPATGAWTEAPAEAGPWDVHASLVHFVALRHSIEFQRSRLLLWLHDRALHRALGMRSADEYALRRLGLPQREVARAVALHGQLLDLPFLARAWREGRLSPTVVALLLRVVTRDTEEAWVEHAHAVPLKRLELETDWHVALAALLPWSRYVELTGGLPHPELPDRRLRHDWEEFFGVREAQRERLRERARSAARGAAEAEGGACPRDAALPAGAGSDDAEGLPAPASALGRPSWVGFRAPRAVAAVWRHALWRVHEVLGWALTDGECVHWMLVAFAHDAAAQETREMRRRHAVFARDGWCCVMPHCRARRNLHAHHVEFRSRGGPDADWNLVTLCVGCHHLVHDEKARVVGRAPGEVIVLVGRLEGGGFREVHRAA